MLPKQTMEKLYAMKLNGMADAWKEQRQQPHSNDLSFDERLALLVERPVDLEGKPRPDHPPAVRPPQTDRLPQGSRLPPSARTQTRCRRPTGFVRVDPPSKALPHYRPYWRGQIVPGLCLGTQSL